MNYWQTIDTTSPEHDEPASIGTTTDSIYMNTPGDAFDISFGPSRSRNDHSLLIQTKSTRLEDPNRNEMTPFLLEGDMNMSQSLSLSPSEAPNSNLHHMMQRQRQRQRQRKRQRKMQRQMQRKMQMERKMFEEMNAQLLISLMKNSNKSRKALERSERSERSRKRSSERASRTTSHDHDIIKYTIQEDHGHVQDFERRPMKRRALDPVGNASHDDYPCHPLKNDEQTHEIEPSFFLQLGLDDLAQQDCEFGGPHDDYDGHVHASSYPFEGSSVDSESSTEQEAEGSTYAAATCTSLRPAASITPPYEHEYAYHDEHENVQKIEPTSLLGSSSRKGFMQKLTNSIPIAEHNSFDMTTITQDDYRNRPLLPVCSEPIPLSCDDKEVLLRLLNVT